MCTGHGRDPTDQRLDTQFEGLDLWTRIPPVLLRERHRNGSWAAGCVPVGPGTVSSRRGCWPM